MTSSSSIYKYAWAGWVYSHIFIDGVLTLFWPLSYTNGTFFKTFYLDYYKYGRIYAGAAIWVIMSILFAISASSGGSWLWFFVYLLAEPAAIFASFWFYYDAYKYYFFAENSLKDGEKETEGKVNPKDPKEPKPPGPDDNTKPNPFDTDDSPFIPFEDFVVAF